jgi:excisionase family DNA binding protein
MPEKKKPKHEPVERRTYRINEFCEAYRVSRSMVYVLMKSGKLRYVNFGTERRIPVEAAEALLTPE